MSGGGSGGTGIDFVDDTVDKVSNAVKDTWGSIEDDPLMTLTTLGLNGGIPQMLTGTLQTVQRIIGDMNDQAMGDAQKEAARAEAARASAIARLPKDPTVEEIARQRRATGGRRGTILTTPGQSLGSMGQSKNLLGL
jgi:hypothetical protein